MKDSLGKNKPKLESLLSESQVFTDEELIEFEKKAALQKIPLHKAMELKRQAVKFSAIINKG